MTEPHQARELVEWIVEAFGYPYDSGSSVQPPDWAIPVLAEVWFRRDNCDSQGRVLDATLTVTDYADQIRDEAERMAGVK